MKVIKEIKQFHDEMTSWRREIHQYPELGFEETRTSDFVAKKLKEFGIKKPIDVVVSRHSFP